MTLRVAVSVVLCAAFAPAALAQGPTGGVVTGGNGRIVKPDNVTTRIEQNSQNLALDWQTFNVAHGHTVEFVQPNSQATALNRIHDQNPSQIFGAIIANGNVFLLNPNGIVFGETGSVNVNSLFATTLDVSADDFMSGNWDFQQAAGGSNGMIINRGLIQAARAGSVTLVAGAVSNEGVILADYGQVTLAGATRTYVDFDGDGLLRFEVSGEIQANPNGVDAAVANAGTIQANGGQVLLTAQAVDAIFRSAVNHEGVISATRIERVGGVVRLGGGSGTTMVAGTVDASSADGVGGTVEITGDRVGLMDGATIDASGATGGGQVNVGGGFQGNDENIQNATVTYVAETATINADATDNGDGGEIIVWADDTTRFYGTISARGGDNGGDGGFVEVSGKEHLQYAGLTDTSAPNGETGTLMLDPGDIVVCQFLGLNCPATTPVTDLNTAGDPDVFTPADAEATSYLDTLTLTTQLGSSNVLVTTAGSTGTGPNGGSITVIDPVVWASANELEFVATTWVSIQAAITNTGTGGFTSSGTDFTTTAAGAITLTGGAVNLDGHTGAISIGAAVTTGGGAFTALNVTSFDSSTVAIDTSGLADGGLVDILATGTVAVGAVNTSGAAGNAGAIELEGLSVGLYGNLTATGTTGNGGAVTVTGPVTLFAAVTVDSQGTGTDGAVQFQNAVDSDAGGPYGLTVDAGAAAVTFGAAVGGTGPLAALAVNTTGAISLGGSVTTTGTQTYGGPVTLNAAGIVLTTTDNAISFINTVTGGAAGFGLDANAGTALIALGGDVTLTDAALTLASVEIQVPLTLSTGTGTIDVGPITATGAHDLTVSNSAAATFDSIALNAGDLILNGRTTGAVSIAGALTAGTIATDGGGFTITLNGGGTLTELTQFNNAGGLSIGASFAFEAGLITSGGPPMTIGGGTPGTVVITALDGSHFTLGSVIIENGYTLQLGSGAAVTNNVILGTVTGDGGSSSLIVNTLGTVELGGAVSNGITSIDVTASDLTVSASIDVGAGTITITSAANGDLSVGAGAGLLIDAAELAFFAGSDVILRTTGAGQLNIAAANASATTGYALTLQTTGSGNIVQTGSFQFGGFLTLDSAGQYTIAGSNLRALGGIVVTAAGGVTATGGVQFITSADPITFNDDITISGVGGSVVVDATDNNNSPAGAAVMLQGVDGTAADTNDLTIYSAQGTTTVAGALVDIGTLTLHRNNADASGTMTFNGTVGTGILVTAPQAHALVFNDALTVTAATTFNNTGSLTLGGAATHTFTAGVTATAPSSVTVDGTVQTTNSAITIGDVVLAGNSTFNAGTALTSLGAVTVTGGDQDLILQGSGGATIASANLGTTSGTLNATGLTGTLTLTGDLTAFALTTSGNALNVSLNGGGSLSGATTLLNTGTLTIGAAGFTFTGGLTATAPTTTLAGNVSTTNSGLSFGAVNLTAPVALSTGSGTITTGAVTATGNQNLSVTNSGGATFDSIDLNAGDLILSGVTGGTITVTNATSANTITTGTGGYQLVLQGGGTLIADTTFGAIGGLSIGADMMFTGGVTATAPPVTITGDTRIEAGDGTNITLGAVTINDTFTLTLGSDPAVNNPISVGSIAGPGAGSANVEFSTTGAVAVSGTVGTNIGTLTVTNSGGATFSGTVDATTVTLTATTGIIAFNGALTATTLNTAAAGYAVTLADGGTVTSAVTFSNTGGLTISNGFNFDGGVTATAQPLSLGGLIQSNGANISFAAATANVTLTANTTISTGAGAGNILFHNGVPTATGWINGAFDLVLTAGTGTAYVYGLVGNFTPLTSITVTSASSTGFAQGAATVGAQSFTAATSVNIWAAHTTTGVGGHVTFTAPNLYLYHASAGQVMSVNTSVGGGDITFAGALSSLAPGTSHALTLNAGTGAIDFQGAVGTGVSTSNLTYLSIAAAGSVDFAGNVTTNGAQLVTASTIRTNGVHTTGNANITFTGDLALEANTTLNAGGAGNITVTGDIDGAFTLFLTGNTGNIDLQGTIGAGTPLAALTINNGAGVILNAATITGALTLTSGTGHTQLLGNVSAGSVDLTTTRSILVQGDITTGGGNIDLSATGGFANGDYVGITIDGAALSTGSGSITLNGTGGDGGALDAPNQYGVLIQGGAVITTTSGDISITGTGGPSIGNQNIGVRGDGSTIEATTTGSVAIIGTGGGSGGSIDNRGIMLTGGMLIGVVDGAAGLVLTGVGGNNHGNGVDIYASTLQSTGSAGLTFNATGLGSQTALLVRDGTLIQSTAGGDITFVLQAGAPGATNGLLTTGAASTISVGSGLLTFTISNRFNDSIATASLIIATTLSGDLLIQPLETGGAIAVGGATDGDGTLGLENAVLVGIQDGFTSITIGRADGAHAVSIGSTTFTDPVTIQAPAVGGSISSVAATTLALTAGGTLTTNGIITLNGSIDATGQTLLLESLSFSVIQAAGSVTASALEARTAGAVTLAQAGNAIGTIAISAGSPVNVVSTTALTVGAVGTTTGITTTNDAVTLTAPDIEISEAITAGFVTVTINESAGAGVSLGVDNGGLHLTAAEINLISATSLRIQTTGDIVVDNLVNAGTGLTGTLVLQQSVSGNIIFSGTASTIAAGLDAFAADRVHVQVDVTAVGMRLYGNYDDTADGNEDVLFDAGVTLTATDFAVTLGGGGTGQNGGIITASGALNVNADGGFSILRPMTTNGLLTVNADTGADGGGSFQILASGSLTTNGNDATVTASDLVIDLASGGINAGVGTLTFNTTNNAHFSGNGAIAGGVFFVWNTELALITADTVIFNVNGALNITPSGATQPFTAVDTDGIANLEIHGTGSLSFNSATALDAVVDGNFLLNVAGSVSVMSSDVTFAAGGNMTWQGGGTSVGTFTLDLRAADHLTVNRSISTSTGTIILTANFGAADSIGDLSFGGAQLYVAGGSTSGSLTLAGENIVFTGATQMRVSDLMTIAPVLMTAQGNVDLGDLSFTGGSIGDFSILFGQNGTGATLDMTGWAGVSAAAGTRNLTGGAGVDTILGPNVNTTWTVTGANIGTLLGTVFGFSAIENLTGGTGNDFFNISGGTLSGSIDGGAGANTLSYGSDTAATSITVTGAGTLVGVQGTQAAITGGYDNITTIFGRNIAGFTLSGSAGDDTFELTGVNSGTLTVGGSDVAFSNMRNLNGSGGDDTFIINGGSLTETLSGSLGSDTIDYSAMAGPVNVNIAAGTASFVGALSDIEHFIGSASADDTLTGPNTANTWNFTAAYTGSVTGGFTFAGFEHLVGGTDADVFNLNFGIASITGGAGVDEVVLAASFTNPVALTLDVESVTNAGNFTLSGTALTLNNFTTVGTLANPLSTNIDNFDGTGNGDVFITEADDLTIDGFDAGTGALQLVTPGTLTVSDGTSLGATTGTLVLGGLSIGTGTIDIDDLTIVGEGNRGVDIGNSVNVGALHLSNATLGQITVAPNLTIATTGAGNITIDGASTAAITNSVVSAQGTGTISVATDPSTFAGPLTLDADTGGIFIGTNLTVSAGNLVIDSATTLTGDITLTMSAGGLTANGTLDSDATPRALTIDASGTVILNADVGVTGALSALSVTADLLQTGAGVTLSTAAQNGPIDLFVDGMTLGAGTVINAGTGIATLSPSTLANTIEVCQTASCVGGFNSQYNLSNLAVTAGTFQIGRATHTGAIRLQALTFGSPLTLVNTSTVTLGGAYSASNGDDLTIDSNLLVDGNRTVITNNGDFTVTGTTNGANVGGDDRLTVQTGTGTATFTGDIGGGPDLERLLITGDVAFLPNVTVGEFARTGATTTTTLTGTTYESTTGTFTLYGTVTLTGDTNVTGAGNVYFQVINGATRNLTVIGAAEVSILDAITVANFDVTAGTRIWVQGDVTTVGGVQDYDGLADVFGTRTLEGATVIFRGDITANSPTSSLSITGDAEFHGAVGAPDPLAALSVSGATLAAANVTTIGAQTYTGLVTLTGTPITLTGTTVRFDGGLTTAGDVTIAGTTQIGANSAFTANLIVFNGDVNGVLGTETLAINGGTRLGAALVAFDLASVTFNGALNATTAGVEGAAITGDAVFGAAVGGTAALASLAVGGDVSNTASFNIITTGAQTYGGDINLGGTLNLQSTGVGAISVAGSVVASGAGFGFGIFNSDGDAIVGGSIGSGTPVQTFTMTSTGGTSYLGGSVTANAFVHFTTDLVLTGDSTITTAASGIWFSGAVDSDGTPRNLTVTLTNATELLFAQDVGATSPLASLTASSVGQLTINGNITTTGNQDYLTPTRLNGAGTRTLTGATVTFADTLISLTNGQSALSVVGDAVFGGIVGAGAGGSPSSVSVSGASDLGANVTAGTQSYGGAVTVSAPILTLTGNVTFGDSVAGDTGTESMMVNGATVLAANGDFSGLVDLLFNGTINGDVAGRTLTIDITGILTFTGAAGTVGTPLGAFTVVGNATEVHVGDVTAQGAITIGSALNPIPVIDVGTLTTTGASGGSLLLQGGGISIVGADVGAHNIALYGDGQDTVVANPITSAGAITISAPRDVVIEALITTTAGDITLTADSDNNGTGGVLVTTTGGLDSAGAVVVNGTSFADGAGGNAGFIGNPITLAGNVTSVGSQTYNDSVVLGAAIALTTTNSAISFVGALDGAQDLTLTAGTGNITFGGAVGGTTPLGALDIVSAGNVTAGAISAANFVQQAGSGTTTLNGAMTTTGAAGISLIGQNLAVNAGLTTTGGGTVFVSMGGTVAIAAAGDINADGQVDIAGFGGVSTAGDITTTGDNATFQSAVTLTGPVAIDTGAGGGHITFDGTVDGGSALTLTAGTGNIFFNAPVGGTTHLGALDIVSATGVTAGTISAASVLQQAGAGTTTLNGALNTNGAAGVSLTGTNLALNAGLTTTGGGTVTVAMGGTAVIAAAGDIVSDGAVSLTATGGITTAGDITTTGDNVTFASAVTMTGPVTIAMAGGTVNFASTLDGGASALTVTGNLDLDGAATNLATLSVSGTSDLGANVTSTGNQAFTGATTLSGGDRTLTGATINFGSTLDGGAAALAVTGNLDLDGNATNLTTLSVSGTSNLGANVTSSGSQTYTDAVVLSADVSLATTGGGSVTFSSTVDSDGTARALTLTAGAGNILFSGLVGDTNPLGAVTVNSAANVTGNGIRAASFTQVAGTGTTTLGNHLHTTDTVAGVSITTRIISIPGAVTTSGGDFVAVATRNIAVTGDITTAGGAVTMTAHTAGNIAENFFGIEITGATLDTGTGAITLTGTGGNDGSDNVGVYIRGGAVIQTTTGAIAITGTGGAGTSSNSGIFITNAGTQVTSVDGDITIQGTGRGSSSTNWGVAVGNGAVVSSTGTGSDAGDITIFGAGGNGTTSNYGVIISNAGTQVTSVDGDITITGTGDGSGGSNRGVYILGGAVVSTTGTGLDAGTIVITGTGAGGAEDILVLNNTTTIGGATTEGAITLTGTAGDIELNGAVRTTGAVSVDAAGSILDSAGTGLITGGLVTLVAGTDIGNLAGNAISTSADNLDLTATAGDIFVSDAGDVTIDAATAAGQVSLDAGGILSIPATTTITAGDDVNLTAVTGIDFGGSIVTAGDGAGVGDVFFNAPVTLTANASVDTTDSGNTAGGTVQFVAGVAGGTNGLTITGNLDLDGAATDLGFLSVSGTSNLGANVTSNGTQVYTGLVTLSGGARTLQGSTIQFVAGVAGGTNDLTITGNLDLDAAATDLGFLSVSGTSNLGADVTTTGLQTYGGAVTVSGGAVTRTLTGAVRFNAGVTGGGTESLTVTGNTTLGANVLFSNLVGLTLDGTVDGDVAGRTLTIDITGTLNLTGAVGGANDLGAFTVEAANQVELPAITVAGGAIIVGNTTPVATINVNGVLTTTGAPSGQLVLSGGGITLGAAPVVGASNIELYGAGQDTVINVPLNLGGNVTISAPRDVIINNAVITTAGDITLTADSDGNNTGGVLVTGAGSLDAAANVIVSGVSFANGAGGFAGFVGNPVTIIGTVDSGNAQTYNGNVVIGASVTLTAGGTAHFTGTVTGDAGTEDLVIAGNLDLDGAATNLNSLLVSGASNLGGNVTTATTQTYSGGVTLSGGHRTLTGSMVNFVSTLAGGGNALTIIGNLDLDGAATGLNTLSVSGTSNLGANVTSSSTQTYSGATTLSGGNRTLTGSMVNFGSTLDGGAAALTVTGNLDLDGAASNLTTLSVSGTSNLGANVTSSGTQTYSGATTLSGGDRTLAGTTVNFGSTLAGGNNALTVTGNLDLDGAATGLSALSVSGASNLGANVTSSGTQTYSGATTLSGGNRTLAGSTVNFASTLDGGAAALTVTGDLNLDGAATNLTTLSVSGTSNLGANVTSTGTQTYTGATTLSGGNRTLTGTTVNFGSTLAGGGNALIITGDFDLDGAATGLTTLIVSGASDLAANVTTTGNQTYTGTVALAGNRTLAANTVVFQGAVNGSGNLTVNGAVTLGANVTTVGTQTYTGAATLTGNRTLSGTTVNFGSTVTGGTRALTITGNLDLDGAATLASLSVSGTSALAADVTTSGNQTYTGAVTLTGARTLTSGATIAFASDVTGVQTITAASIQTAGTHSGTAIVLNGPVVMNANTTFSGDVIELDSVSGGRVLTLVSTGTVTLDGTVDVGSVALGGLTGAVVLGGATTITTANTAVDFSAASSINGANALVINAGSAAITLPTTGTGTALTAITLSGGSLDLGAVRTTGAQTYTGATVLRGNLTTSAGGGDIRFNSPVTLANNLTIHASAAGSDITFMGALNGARALTVDAGAGNVNFNAQVGGTAPLTSLTVVGNAAIRVTSGAVTTGVQNYTGRAIINGELVASALIFNGVVQLDAANTAILISDTVDFNGGTGSVIGAGVLSIVPATQDATIDIGGTSGTLNLSGAAFDGFDGVLTIGAVDTDNTTPIIAGAITINDAITLSASGTLYLLSNNGDIVLANGVVEAGTLVMVAAGGSILNTAGEAGIFRADSVVMVAADEIGGGIGLELNVEKLSTGGDPARVETALGGQQSFVNNDPTINILATVQAPAARAIAQQRNITTNDQASNTNAGQAAASREQGGGVSESGAIDPSLFEQISLWAVEQGLLLPRDQREDYEELDECEPDELDCESVLTRALSDPGQVAVVAGCCSV